MHPTGGVLELLALTGWTGDRNPRAMRGAQAMGRRIARRTGATLRELGAIGPVGHLPWREALARARPHLDEVGAEIERAVASRRPSLVFENRCATSVATIPAGLRARPELAVLYLDAQADFNTPETTPSQYLGGMVISAACGLWDSGCGAGLDPRRLVLTGCRDIDPDERVLLERHGVPVHQVGDVDAIVERLRGHPVWIHLDLDVIEPGTIPTEYRVPGGPDPGDVRALFAAVAGACEVAVLEVAEYELPEDAAEDAAEDPARAEAAIEHVLEPVLARWTAR
jgi:arginase/N-omega-hydroxy-L-arginine amidinohydrolase